MKRRRHILMGALAGTCLVAASTLAQMIPVTENLWRLVAQEDTDGDQKITIHDHTTPFAIHDAAGVTVRSVTNTYPLSILLQELKQADNQHQENIAMNDLPLDENIVDRTHRFIQTKFWDALTRRLDGDHVDQVVHDSKAQSKFDYIYVPAADTNAVNYFLALEKYRNDRHCSPPLKVVGFFCKKQLRMLSNTLQP